MNGRSSTGSPKDRNCSVANGVLHPMRYRQRNPNKFRSFVHFVSRMTPCSVVSTATFCIIVPIAALFNPYFAEHRSVGLLVHVASDISPFPANVLILRIDGRNNFHLNSVPVRRKSLRDELQRALVLPFGNAVFVEGDPEADYQTVIFAIEAVRDAGAQAILVSKAHRR